MLHTAHKNEASVTSNTKADLRQSIFLELSCTTDFFYLFLGHTGELCNSMISIDVNSISSLQSLEFCINKGIHKNQI